MRSSSQVGAREVDTDETKQGLPPLRDEGERLFLVIVGDGLFRTHALPPSGKALIGRAHDVDIRLDDASISRHHARIEIGDRITIEDLGSVNGTFARDGRLTANAPTEIAVNEALQIGAVTAIVQHHQSTRRGRQFRTHDYFETRLEDECARNHRAGSTFAVAHVVVPAEQEQTAQSIIAGHLRDADVMATYAPGEIELLLVDATVDATDQIVERAEEGLGQQNIEVRIGVAHYPIDARGAGALISTARLRAHGSVGLRTEQGDVVVVDERMRTLHALVARVAAADISVLLLGETGVGKEVIAETIHRLSQRSKKQFLRLNCAALTETLLESELFGHERGAFTGATQNKVGLLEAADGGIVFLDEIGELAMSTQSKLLRVLDEKKVLPVGGVKPRSIDVRVISATNRDLEVEVHRGMFRLDLFYRLNAMSIVIPPLRERVAEIEPLVRHFISAFSTSSRRTPPRLASDALRMLETYPWPGNVRELRNVIERALVLCNGDEIIVKDLPTERMHPPFMQPPPPPPGARAALRPTPSLPSQRGSSPPEWETGATRPMVTWGVTEAESKGPDHARVVAALEECGGNQTHAAKKLGVSRRTLVTWIEKLGITRPRKR